MDFKQLERNPEYISKLIVTNKDGSMSCKKPLTIMFPKWFEVKELAIISKVIKVVGYFAIIVDNKFSVSKVASLIQLGNGIVNTISINGDEYYSVSFKENSSFISYNKIMVENAVAGKLLDSFTMRGNVPVYFNYNDTLTCLENCSYYAGSGYTNNQDVLQLITSLLSRYKDDNEFFYRDVIRTTEDLKTKEVEYVSLYSVSFAASSTFSKLVGSYFTEGVNSALITNSTEVDKVEELLRG